MNCPSRTEEPEGDGFNQNPSWLAADLTTRQDLNGIANARTLRSSDSEVQTMEELEPGETSSRDKKIIGVKEEEEEGTVESHGGTGSGSGGLGGGSGDRGQRFNNLSGLFMRARKFAMTFGKFIGPGFMVCLLDIILNAFH